MRKCFLYISLLTLLVSGCKTDFEVNDPWKEVNVIYALMSTTDSINTSVATDSIYPSTQYFRITKMFSNSGSNALNIAKIPDSLYNKNWVVTLYEMNGSLIADSFTLKTVDSIPRDLGVFASPEQVLYKTPSNFKLKASSTYKIKVYDTKTKITSTATTNIVNPIGYQSPFYYPKASIPFHFERGKQHNVRFWNTGKNSRFYDLTYIIHYLEWPGNNTSATVEKTVSWPIFRNFLTNDLNGGAQFNYSFEGGDFFSKMAADVPVNPNVTRRFKGVEVSMAAGGEELYTYLQVNTPSQSIVQKKTDYTNVTNGYGIFSSRAETKYFLPVDKQTIDSLLDSRMTNQLRFIR